MPDRISPRHTTLWILRERSVLFLFLKKNASLFFQCS